MGSIKCTCHKERRFATNYSFLSENLFSLYKPLSIVELIYQFPKGFILRCVFLVILSIRLKFKNVYHKKNSTIRKSTVLFNTSGRITSYSWHPPFPCIHHLGVFYYNIFHVWLKQGINLILFDINLKMLASVKLARKICVISFKNLWWLKPGFIPSYIRISKSKKIVEIYQFLKNVEKKNSVLILPWY